MMVNNSFLLHVQSFYNPVTNLCWKFHFQCVFGSYHFLGGGCQFDGSEITPVDKEEVKTVINNIYADGIRNVVIAGIFCSVDSSQELKVSYSIQYKYFKKNNFEIHNLCQCLFNGICRFVKSSRMSIQISVSQCHIRLVSWVCLNVKMLPS